MFCFLQRKNLFTYLFGIFLMPCGVVLTINSGLGAGGCDALNFALADVLHINTSVAIYMIGVGLICITAIIRQRAPKIATLVALAVIGACTDFWATLLHLVIPETIILQFVCLILGNVIIAFSVGMYMASSFPTNPQDDFVKALVEKGWRIRVAKILFDGVCVLCAVVLKGNIGVGTILSIILLGPTVDFFHGITTKYYLKKPQKKHSK